MKSSKLLSKQINRIIEYSKDSEQVNILDQRFYKRNGKYYPSVSSILSYYPKGKFFDDWIKSNGHNSDIIASKAAGEGTQVHNAVEAFINGQELNWIDEYGNARYNLDVWRMILRFADFWNTHKPELIATEYHLFSDKHEYAGTADLVVRFAGFLWLLDLKTSNNLHTSYDLQLAAYANAWNETHDEKVTHTGLLWVKSNTRGGSKNSKLGKIQGKGWELKIVSDIDKNFNMFKNIHEIYKLENPDSKPYTESLPTSIKITV